MTLADLSPLFLHLLFSLKPVVLSSSTQFELLRRRSYTLDDVSNSLRQVGRGGGGQTCHGDATVESKVDVPLVNQLLALGPAEA